MSTRAVSKVSARAEPMASARAVPEVRARTGPEVSARTVPEVSARTVPKVSVRAVPEVKDPAPLFYGVQVGWFGRTVLVAGAATVPGAGGLGGIVAVLAV